AAPSDAQGSRHDPRGGPFAPRDEHVVRTRGNVSEDTDRGAQFAILTGGRVSHCEELSARRARWYKSPDDLTVTAQKRRRRSRRFAGPSGYGCLCALDQEIGDPGECRRDDDERTWMGRDEDGGPRDR